MKESVVGAGALVVATLSPLFSSLSQPCPGSAPSDVCSQKSAVRRLWWARRGASVLWGWGARRGPEENPSFSGASEFTRFHSTATHPSVSIPHFFPLFALFIWCLSSSRSLSDPHHSLRGSLSFTHVSSQPATLTHTHSPKLQLGKIQRLPLFPESFQFGTEPLGHLRHSPVPPHPALLVTWDNWGRDPDRENWLWVSLWAANRRWEDVFKTVLPLRLLLPLFFFFKLSVGTWRKAIWAQIRATARLMFLWGGYKIGNVHPHSPPTLLLARPPQSPLCEGEITLSALSIQASRGWQYVKLHVI